MEEFWNLFLRRHFWTGFILQWTNTYENVRMSWKPVAMNIFLAPAIGHILQLVYPFKWFKTDTVFSQPCFEFMIYLVF